MPAFKEMMSVEEIRFTDYRATIKSAAKSTDPNEVTLVRPKLPGLKTKEKYLLFFTPEAILFTTTNEAKTPLLYILLESFLDWSVDKSQPGEIKINMSSTVLGLADSALGTSRSTIPVVLNTINAAELENVILALVVLSETLWYANASRNRS